MSKILFLGGPSGSGKSHFASEYLTSRGWVHLEIDQFPNDGISEHGLRTLWDAFLLRFDPIPLREELLVRAAGAEGIVLTFPSTLVFLPQHFRTAEGSFEIAYLFGLEAYCLTSFLKRESERGGELGVAHWRANNAKVFSELKCPENRPLLVNVFHEDGTRRDPKEIFEDLFRE